MPYVMNFIRVPKAGKAFELLEAMKKSHSASGKQGGITVPISGAVPTDLALWMMLTIFKMHFYRIRMLRNPRCL